MDGPFYHDSRTPFLTGDIPAVTLATTLKSLTPIANVPLLGSNYFNYVGKALRVRVFGRQSTGATPGNLTMALLYGTGADNTGNTLVSTAGTGTANQTSVSWLVDVIVRCRTLGATGSLMCTGMWFIATQGFFCLPSTVPAAVTCDLTANNLITVQAMRSGSTAESWQVHDISFESLN